MNLTEHEQKLLLRALDKASAPAEAEKAAEALINLLRKRGINGYDFLKQFEWQSYSRPQEQRRQYQPPPEPPPPRPQHPPPQQAPPRPQPWPPQPNRKFPWLYFTLCFVVWLISHNVIVALIVGAGIAWMIQKRIILRVIGAVFALGLLYVGLVMSPTNTLKPRYASEPATGEFQPSMQEQIDRHKASDEVKQAAAGSYIASAVSPTPTPEATPVRSAEPVIKPDPRVVDLVNRINSQPSMEEQIARYKAQEGEFTNFTNDWAPRAVLERTPGSEPVIKPAPEAANSDVRINAQPSTQEQLAQQKAEDHPAPRAELVSPRPQVRVPRAQLVNPLKSPSPRANLVDPYTPEMRARIKALKARGVREQDISVE
jgi:hypothetical protein